MEPSDKDQGKKNIPQVQAFTFPFASGEIKENITITTNTPSKPSKEQIINQAFKFHSQGNILEATKYYEYFINQGFKDHVTFANYGLLLKDLGNLKDAELLQRKAIELNPNYADAHSNLGGILKDLDELKEAEVSTRKAIELKPDFADAHSNLGGILKDLDKLKEAEVSTRKAIELKPDFADAHSNLGGILKDLDELKEAEFYTRKAIELNPNFADAHLNLGGILKDLDELKEAEVSTRKAIELNPNFADAYLNLGGILKDLDELKEAEVFTRKAIELKPDFADAHLNLGSILKELDQLEEAEVFTRKAIELNPGLSKAHEVLGLIHLEKGSYELSLENFLESSQLVRGHKNKETNQERFRRISQAKIEHDIEQFEYLASKGYDSKKFSDLAFLYKKVYTEINWPSETEFIYLNNEHHSILKNSYNRLINVIEAPRLKEEVINNSLDIEQITNDYTNHEFGLTFIDNLLSSKAIESLRKFLLESTIWFDIKRGGYIGAYLAEGFANPLIIQIADQLRQKFPKIFKDYHINKIWAYKYDSRAKNYKSSLNGINVHADFAAVNVNFWLTTNEANLNPNSGGLIVYDVEAPKAWDFKTYNTNVTKIQEEIKRNKANTTVIPYRENRAVVFNSNLFHETDRYEFREGYENRRINVTLLFGRREDS
ncbi:tetratricopeptide repeat protein [Prochlorococcus marinus]|uniref:tetratricopeptide repeat protein n=1 Tax=Prochlorococcus marinus TaxID=1219 RepID=UPI0022B412A6|nr:tetratricopeptide repeat protein [Prochlorococcus marinus]